MTNDIVVDYSCQMSSISLDKQFSFYKNFLKYETDRIESIPNFVTKSLTIFLKPLQY